MDEKMDRSILLSHFEQYNLLEEQVIARYMLMQVTHIETQNNFVITHTLTAVVTTGTNAQVLQHGTDRTQHTAFAYIATQSGIYGDATARLRMYSSINQAPIQIMHGTIIFTGIKHAGTILLKHFVYYIV